jgi:hypothetical protein
MTKFGLDSSKDVQVAIDDIALSRKFKFTEQFSGNELDHIEVVKYYFSGEFGKVCTRFCEWKSQAIHKITAKTNYTRGRCSCSGWRNIRGDRYVCKIIESFI